MPREQEGAQLNVVFMDNDILVFNSLARIFETEDFDYGCTISDSPIMPVRRLTYVQSTWQADDPSGHRTTLSCADVRHGITTLRATLWQRPVLLTKCCNVSDAVQCH